MKMTFIGAGSAFTINNYQSNILLMDDSEGNLLLDCGSDARRALSELSMSHLDVQGVYVSHLHADHVGGLEWLGFASHFDPRYKGKPKLFLSKDLRARIWENTLKAGMESIQGDVANLDTYFETTSIKKNGKFVWGDAVLTLIQVIHVVNGFSIEHSYGAMIDVNGKKVFWTSDTQFAPEQINDFYAKADIIFQDCETTPFESKVHAHYNRLKTLPEDIKSKMWLYHYSDGKLPDAKADGFCGFVEKGQTFNF